MMSHAPIGVKNKIFDNPNEQANQIWNQFVNQNLKQSKLLLQMCFQLILVHTSDELT